MSLSLLPFSRCLSHAGGGLDASTKILEENTAMIHQHSHDHNVYQHSVCVWNVKHWTWNTRRHENSVRYKCTWWDQGCPYAPRWSSYVKVALFKRVQNGVQKIKSLKSTAALTVRGWGLWKNNFLHLDYYLLRVVMTTERQRRSGQRGLANEPRLHLIGGNKLGFGCTETGRGRLENWGHPGQKTDREKKWIQHKREKDTGNHSPSSFITSTCT